MRFERGNAVHPPILICRYGEGPFVVHVKQSGIIREAWDWDGVRDGGGIDWQFVRAEENNAVTERRDD